MRASVAELQGAPARGKPKAAAGQPTTAGTRTASEAGRGRQAGEEQRSPTLSKTRTVEADGTLGQFRQLTRGDSRVRSGRGVSSGRRSAEAP